MGIDLSTRSLNRKVGETPGAQGRSGLLVETGPSYWGEAEAREWRRQLREEKEKVEREKQERLRYREEEVRRCNKTLDSVPWNQKCRVGRSQ